MTSKSLISAAIAAIENNQPDAAVNEAFALACGWKCGCNDFVQCEWSDGLRISPHAPSYCTDLQAVLDEMPEGFMIGGINRLNTAEGNNKHNYIAYIYNIECYEKTHLSPTYAGEDDSIHRALMLALLYAKLQQ